MMWWTVEEAKPEHIQAIAANMRPADVREVWASHRHRPVEALTFSLGMSVLAWTCSVDGIPVFMWGVCRVGSLMSPIGAPWLLGTPGIAQRRVVPEFLRQCPAYTEQMQARFPRLENYVHRDNVLSIRWLRWLGFTIETADPVLKNLEPFYLFWREHEC